MTGQFFSRFAELRWCLGLSRPPRRAGSGGHCPPPAPRPPACSGSHAPREKHSCHSKYTALGTAVRILFSGIASQREEPQRLGWRPGFWLRRGHQVSPAGLLTSGLGLSLGDALLLVVRLRPRAGFLSACFLVETEDRHKVGLTSDVHCRGGTHVRSVGAA